MQWKLNDLVEESAKVGLKLKAKTKSLKARATNTRCIYKIDNENTDSFNYLGSVITTDGGAKEDILHRISKEKATFAQLNKI